MTEATQRDSGPKRESPSLSLANRALAAGFCAFESLAAGDTYLIYRADSEDRLEWISRAGARLLGHGDSGELVGRPAGEALYRQSSERQPLLAALSAGDCPVCQEEILCRADGSTLAVRTRAIRRKDAHGGYVGMEAHALVLSGEIEARLILAKALREMETIFDNALVGMMLVRGGRIEKVNTRGAAVFGYARAALAGAETARLFPDTTASAAFDSALERDLALSGTHVSEHELVRQDGRPVVVRVAARRISPDSLFSGVIWSFEDVTEQNRLAEELRTSKKAAEAANQAKTQFLANMSHELRTPLNGILGMAQLLLDTAKDGETRECLGIIRQSAATLMRIVGGLLDLSAVEAGRVRIEEREFVVRDELTPLLRNFAAQSQFRAFEFAFAFDPQVPDRLIGDPDRLKQILINLIGNAFKYTRKGMVAVRIGVPVGPQTLPRPGRFLLGVEVSDTGVGIAASHQAALFEPFAIGEDYLTKKYSGAGLGLAVARRLARMMGGDVAMKSQSGRGSVFSLTLDCGLPSAPPARPAGRVPAVVAPGRSLHILLAEDEPINRIFTCRTLQKHGHTVETAVDGREALAALARDPFDLVLMDIQMPRLNGLEATRLIRAGQVAGVDSGIPVVALTAYAGDSDRERGLEAGIDEYVTKPFEPAELIAAMERALGR